MLLAGEARDVWLLRQPASNGCRPLHLDDALLLVLLVLLMLLLMMVVVMVVAEF